jgi:hypothetical protein
MTKLKGNKTPIKKSRKKNKKLKEEGPNHKYKKTKKTNQQFVGERREKNIKKEMFADDKPPTY